MKTVMLVLLLLVTSVNSAQAQLFGGTKIRVGLFGTSVRAPSGANVCVGPCGVKVSGPYCSPCGPMAGYGACQPQGCGSPCGLQYGSCGQSCGPQGGPCGTPTVVNVGQQHIDPTLQMQMRLQQQSMPVFYQRGF